MTKPWWGVPVAAGTTDLGAAQVLEARRREDGDVTTVLCLCRVADFDAWRPQFERDVDAASGVQSYRIWRNQDDPNLVAVIETRDSRDLAEAVWSSPQAREAMERHGVDLSSVEIRYFDEVADE